MVTTKSIQTTNIIKTSSLSLTIVSLKDKLKVYWKLVQRRITRKRVLIDVLWYNLNFELSKKPNFHSDGVFKYSASISFRNFKLTLVKMMIK